MRGGTGQSGRYRHKKSRLIRDKEFFEMRYEGKKGFTSIYPNDDKKGRVINISQLSNIVEELVSGKKAQLDKDQRIVLDLYELGFTRLLGAGVLARSVQVKVNHCSAGALKKIKEVGGEAVLLGTQPK